MRKIHWADALAIGTFAVLAVLAGTTAYQFHKENTCRTLYFPARIMTMHGPVPALIPYQVCGR